MYMHVPSISSLAIPLCPSPSKKSFTSPSNREKESGLEGILTGVQLPPKTTINQQTAEMSEKAENGVEDFTNQALYIFHLLRKEPWTSDLIS